MLSVYLACLVFGGILLSVSLFAHSDTDTDTDFHMDADHDFSTDMHLEADSDLAADVHMDTDVPAEVHIDADAEGGVHADSGSHGEGVTAAIQFLSFRNIVFFLTFFGLTGSVLTWLDIPSLLILMTAILMGLFTATLSHKLMTYMKKSESGQVIHLNELEGFTGRVTVNLSKTHKGKISVTGGDQNLQLVALVADEASEDEFRYGDSVIILRIENGTAYVVGEDFIRQ